MFKCVKNYGMLTEMGVPGPNPTNFDSEVLGTPWESAFYLDFLGNSDACGLWAILGENKTWG